MRNRKRLFCLLLCAALCLSLLPTAYAEGDDDEVAALVEELPTVSEKAEPSVEPAPTEAPAPDADEELQMLHYVSPAWSGPSNDALFESYLTGLFYGETLTPAEDSLLPGNVANSFPGDSRNKLTATQRSIEQRLKACIEQVANGSTTDTVFEISVSDLNMNGFTYSSLWEVYDVLLMDCTASLYWHDVRLGARGGFNSSSVALAMYVSADYRSGDYKVNASKITAAKNAKKNADAIVAKHANKCDVEKLRAYMWEICALNSYNYDAADNHSNDTSFGIDPWQLVYVFDGDSSTNVVCEGYSKAYQYLCDNSSFTSSKINCYCATGIGHMWNIVHMDDDRNYVVDVTWSDTDSGTPVCNEAMFLSYAISGSYSGTYTMSFGDYGSTQRSYDSDSLSVYSAADLTLSNTPYSFPQVAANNVAFTGAMQLHTYIVIPDHVLADSGAYATISFNGETTKVKLSNVPVDTRNGVVRRDFVQTVYAAKMRDPVVIRLYDSKGRPLTLLDQSGSNLADSGCSNSVLDYLDGRIANSTDSKMVALARAAKNYGTAAQIYFGYNTELLTNADISALNGAIGASSVPTSMAAYAVKTSGTLPSGITKNTSNVQFLADNSLYEYFYLASGAKASSYTFTVNGKKVTPLVENGRCAIVASNIPSGRLSTAVTFTVSDGKNTYTLQASPLSYAYGRVQNSTDANMIKLAKALYLYSMAANAYFG